MKAHAAKNEVCSNWMRPEAVSIQIDASIEDALIRMKKLSIHHLIVKDGLRYCGILDARDCAGIWNKNQKVENVMQVDIPIVDENTDIKTVVEMMVNRDLTAVPMEREKQVCGIITVTDLVRLLEARLTRQFAFSRLVYKGKDFLSQPMVQSLSSLIGNAGI